MQLPTLRKGGRREELESDANGNNGERCLETGGCGICEDISAKGAEVAVPLLKRIY